MIRDYLRYRLGWQTRHDIHSPFIFDFIETVLRDGKKYPEYAELKELRRKLSQDQTSIELTDLGAGSHQPAKSKTVAQLLNVAVQPSKYQQLLFRMIRKYSPEHVIELGTSLGLSTAYLGKAMSPGSSLTTFEGDPAILDVARRNSFSIVSPDVKLESVLGNFDQTLPEYLNSGAKVDLAYIDGNHTYEATLRYFECLLPRMSVNGILIFDDIYWSEGMKKAWIEIHQDKRTQYTADLFKLGVVFLAPVLVKQHFVLKY